MWVCASGRHTHPQGLESNHQHRGYVSVPATEFRLEEVVGDSSDLERRQEAGPGARPYLITRIRYGYHVINKRMSAVFVEVGASSIVSSRKSLLNLHASHISVAHTREEFLPC